MALLTWPAIDKSATSLGMSTGIQELPMEARLPIYWLDTKLEGLNQHISGYTDNDNDGREASKACGLTRRSSAFEHWSHMHTPKPFSVVWGWFESKVEACSAKMDKERTYQKIADL